MSLASLLREALQQSSAGNAPQPTAGASSPTQLLGGGYAPGSLQVVPGADGMYSAVNPRTGKLEPVLNDNDTSQLYFPSDGNAPASASQAGPTSYHTDNSGTFDNFLQRGIQGGLGALGVLATGGIAGFGPAAAGTGGMTAADAATLGGMTEGAGAAGATGGLTGLPLAAAPAPAALPAVAGYDLGGGLSVDAAGNVTGGAMGLSGGAAAAVAGGTAAAGGGAAAAGAGAGSLASRLTGGNASNADLIQLLGTLGATGLGVYGANQQSNALHDIYSSMEAKREPYRAKSLEYLNDPNAYIQGPGQTALQGVLRGLSVQGNPIDNPTSLGIATQAAMSDWRNAVTGFGNLGLSGEDTRANVASNSVNAGGGAYDALGYGLGALTQPRRRSLSDLLVGQGLV